MRKIFLDDLPTTHKGIDWKNSVGLVVEFIYDNIQGYIKIIDYNLETKYLKVEYNNKCFELDYRVFRECGLSKILGKINPDFIFKIGTRFKDEKRDVTVIAKQKDDKRGKMYKYKCNKCGFDCGEHWNIKDKMYKQELWTTEGNLNKGDGCACCANQIVVKHINSLVTTDPWMIKYFQEGIEEAKKYTRRSNQKIQPICSDCGRVKNKKMSINTLYREGISCACKDGISYPNKFMFSVLEQLGINFKTEYSPKWCKYLFKDKLRQGRYDFYFKFNDKKYIIEMDGKQHKKEINVGKWIKFKEQVYIDNQKDQLAIQHGIHIIRIDSEKSELNFIKNNILDKLSKLFDLHKIDWLICHDYACCSRTKEVWDLWKDNINNIAQLSSLTGISKSIVNKYLKQGNELNIIKYNPRESIEKLYEQKRKSIVAISPNQDISVFNSMLECEKYSMKIFGVKLYTSCISSVCKGDRNKHKGYIFKYIKDLTTEEYIKYDIENKLNELHNNELVQAC